jgi:hypothetical protein
MTTNTTRKALSAAALFAVALLALAPVAQANKTTDSVIGPPGSGNGQLNDVYGISVNQTGAGGVPAGTFYVVDSGNNRIVRFNPDGSFNRAWGWDVQVGGGTEFEICIDPSPCKAGVGSGTSVNGAGQGIFRGSIAVDQSTGDVYTAANNRIQKFDANGNWKRLWGRDVVKAGGTGDTAPVNEKESVTLVNATGGTFVLTISEATDTPPIPFNATAAQVQSAIEAVVGAGNVAVSGAAGGPWTIDYIGTRAATNVVRDLIRPSALTGPGHNGVVATVVDGGGGGAEICTVAAQCKAAIEGGLGGELSAAGASLTLTVDGSGSVYATEPTNSRVSKFDSGGGFLRAWGNDVIQSGKPGDLGAVPEICTVAADCKGPKSFGSVSAFSSALGAVGSGEASIGISADASNAVYVTEKGFTNYRTQRFNLDGTEPQLFATSLLAGQTPGQGPTTDLLTADPIDHHVFAGGPAGSPFEYRIKELDAAGNLIDTHAVGVGIPTLLERRGMAIDHATGKIYLTGQYTSIANAAVIVLDDDGGYSAGNGTTPTVSDVEAHSASFAATTNPNGVFTRARFEVSKDGVDWSTAGPEIEVGSGIGDVPVSLAASGLTPNTFYRVRLVVISALGGTFVSDEAIFLTDAVAPNVTTLGVSSRTDTSAVLAALVDPQGSPTTYRFNYGTSSLYGSSAPVPEGSAGSGIGSTVVAQPLSNLLPSTTYHYRVVATNPSGTVFGADRTFTTDAVPEVSDPLGDRGYELVSPADKPTGPGVGIHGFNSEFDGAAGVYAGVASLDGDRYISSSDFGQMLAPDGEASYTSDTVFGERTPSGWVNRDAINRHDYSSSIFITLFSAYGYNDNLSLSLFTKHGGLLTQGAKLFPEMASWATGEVSPRYIRDWKGNWRLLDPFDSGYGSFVETGGTAGVALGDDDGHIALTTSNRGTLGPDDPTLDQMAGTAVAGAVDVPDGISDTFEDRGVSSLLGVCTGSGPDRTRVPNVDGSGKLGERACPAPLPGRSAALIDSRGSSTYQPGDSGVGSSGNTENLVSDDGKRAFFMSPDTSSQVVGGACAGEAEATKCPPQLYVRQTEPDGSFGTRWISRSQVANQDASLLGPAYFAGASSFGDKVFFQSDSPLSADDPNGKGVVPPVGGVTTGSVSDSSWDLYEYDLPSDEAGHANGSDPASGTLTRISGGPSGTGECSGPLAAGGTFHSSSMLRFSSDDGKRVFFTCSAPLPGVPAPSDGTITEPVGNDTTTNLYFYDSTKPPAERWEFVAALPYGNSSGESSSSRQIAGCASTGTPGPTEGTPLATGGLEVFGDNDCVRGNSAGSFISFWSKARLTADDPDSSSVDIYAFDADRDELARISAPQGGAGGTYTCVQFTDSRHIDVDGTQCYGDPGFSNSGDFGSRLVNVAAEPENPNDKIVYFQSRSRLTSDDKDNHYDVYQWRNGELSIVSKGIDDTGAYYAGNDKTGRDVFLITSERITWQDIDGVYDVYDARIGGGIPQPPPPPACDVLAGGCQGPAQQPTAPSTPASTGFSDAGNVKEGKPRKKHHKPRKKHRGKHKAAAGRHNHRTHRSAR